MKPILGWPLKVVWAALLLCLIATVASAQGGDLTLARWAIGSGAAGLTGDGYEMGGTVGLFAAGRLAGGGYALAGGFWERDIPTPAHMRYLPLVLK